MTARLARVARLSGSDRLTDVCLLAGEATWLAGIVALMIGWGGGEAGPVFGATLLMLLAAWAVTAVAQRVGPAFGDRWLVGGAGILVAAIYPLLLAPERDLLAPLGISLWVTGILLWVRGVWLSNERQTSFSIGVSFSVGFVALTITLLSRAGRPMDLTLLPVGFVLAYMGALAMVTLDAASDRTGGRLGSEWVGITAATLALALVLTVGALSLFGPILEGPIIAVLTLLAQVLATVIAIVFLPLGFILSLLIRFIVDALSSQGLRINDGAPLDGSAGIDELLQAGSILPDWLLTVLQVSLVVTLAGLIALAVAAFYRRRLVTRGQVAAGERRAVATRASLTDDLFGWMRRGKRGEAGDDPLQRFGDDGRWLRTHFDRLAREVGDADGALTAGSVNTRAAADSALAPVAATTEAFDRSRYGLLAPDAETLRDLKQRWGRQEKPKA